jgi:hypothetical protein
MFGQGDGEIHSLMTVLDKQNVQSDDALAALLLGRQAQFSTVTEWCLTRLLQASLDFSVSLCYDCAETGRRTQSLEGTR